MDRIAKLNELLKNSPADSFLKHALALEYIKLGNDSKAKALFESVIENEPGYIGSYYHLGRLLVRTNDIAGATSVYEKGMAEAKKAGETHAFNELKGAYEELVPGPGNG